jgi:Tfp pilus assembly protein PilN
MSMRIPINLASEPFRRDRAQLTVSAICGVALVALLSVMVFLIFSERNRLKETRVAVENLNSELRKITTEQAQVDATLRQPANAEVLQRSVLLNALVERKSISWAKIFADLESVLPNNVRIIQIRLPQINSRNEVSLDMEVGTTDPTQVVTFLKNLENSPVFGSTSNPRGTPPTQSEPLYRYRITVNYAQKL